MTARLLPIALCLIGTGARGGAAIAAEPSAEGPVANLGPKVARADLLSRPIGITLSGGASLGSYEAGYLHYVLRELHSLKVRPRVLTGTSAGSINAFVGLVESCTKAPRLPTDSLLYRTWMPIGLDQLFRPAEVSASSVLSRRGFDAAVAQLRRAWLEGLDADCDIRLSTAVTRKNPRTIKISTSEVSIPRMSERFLVRVRGRGEGLEPLVENARTQEVGRLLALLPVDGADAHPFDSIVDTLLASSGVPLAFPAFDVALCTALPKNGDVPPCRPADASKTTFIDGGVFDNRPIGIAYSVLKELAEPGQAPALLFIDPTLRTWPLPDTVPVGSGKGVLSLVSKMLLDFVDTAMQAELERLIEREPALANDLFIGQVHYPPVSAALGAFLGFVERELRRFDFYLGMYNARRFVAVERGVAPSQLGEDGRDTGDVDNPAWRPLRCLRALWDGDGDPDVLCAGAGMREFAILAQLAGEQVANDCAKSPAGADSKHPICVRAREHRPPPAVPGVKHTGDPTQHATENDLDWTMRRLGELAFTFSDLGLPAKHSSRGALVLRARLGSILEALARQQGTTSIAYVLIASYGLNFLRYLPPRHLFHILLGDRIEVGWSYTDPTSVMRWARFATSLSLRGLETIFSSKPIYFGITPTVGVELEPLFLSRAAIQTRIGFHAGFMFSTEDRMLARGCDVHASVPCSRPLVEVVVALTLFGTMRFQLAGTWLPAIRPGESQGYSVTPGFGVELPFVGRRYVGPRPGP